MKGRVSRNATSMHITSHFARAIDIGATGLTTIDTDQSQSLCGDSMKVSAY